MKKYLLIAIIGLVFLGCKKSGDSNLDPTQEEVIGDGLSEEDNLFVESIIIDAPPLNELLDGNGNPIGREAGTQDVKSPIIKGMIRDAKAFDQAKTTLTNTGTGPTNPTHMGYAYSYGQRDLTQRLNPPGGNTLHKKYAVFGTDCSGFIITLLRKNGINIANTNVQGFEKALNTTLQNTSSLSGIRVANLGKLPSSELKTGDFILWPGHMGIIANSKNNGKVIFQSNGTPNPGSEAEQAKNWGAKRGIHCMPFNLAVTGTGYWGNGYSILRLLEAGDSLQGGLIFYLDATGKHGLVCAPSDQSPGVQWFNGTNMFTNSSGLEVGMGETNTANIVSALGNGLYAAKLCDQLALNGFSDWFLPSRDELGLMYARLKANNLGNFSSADYWSSSETTVTNDGAWCHDFSANIAFKWFKNGQKRVRAVRKF